jgi:hypothetical protein
LVPLASDSWWRRPLVFHFGQRPESVDDLITLIRSSNALSEDLASEVALTAGLAVQACYLGLVSKKIDVWKLCAEELARATVKLREQGESEKAPILVSIMQVLEAKDAVALSHLVDHHSDMVSWCTTHSDEALREKLLFWLVTALMEHGNIEPVLKVLREKAITDPLLLIGLDIQAHVFVSVRAADSATKALAEQVLKHTGKAVSHLRDKLLAELKSLTLEHNGTNLIDVSKESESRV